MMIGLENDNSTRTLREFVVGSFLFVTYPDIHLALAPTSSIPVDFEQQLVNCPKASQIMEVACQIVF